MRICDIENSVNFYFDKDNRKKLQEMVRKAEEEESYWETIYSYDYEEGKSGVKITKYKGKLHSRNDEPSFIHYYSNGTKHLSWHKEGKLHRLTGPAFIYSNGNGEYYIEGRQYNYESWLIERKKHPDWREDSILESE